MGVIPVCRKLSDEELIKKIQEFVQRFGRVPRRKEMLRKSKECPEISSLQRHFGSYERAIKKAGFNHPFPYIQITDEELIQALKNITAKLGHVPSYTEMLRNKEYPHPCTYRARFGSWIKALKIAGLKRSRKYISDEELIFALQNVANKLGRVPTYWELNKMGGCPSPRTYHDRFGSWKKALKKAGLKYKPYGYTIETLLEFYDDLSERLGHMPSFKEVWQADGFPSPRTFSDHFGSWKKLKKAYVRWKKKNVKKQVI